MSPQLADLRAGEYGARLEANRLRRRLYDDPAGADAELFTALAEAEERLGAAEAARQQAQAGDESAGVILDTRTDDGLLGPKTTGLEVTLTLRMEHVPTAVANLLEAQDAPLVSCTVKNESDHTRRLRIRTYIEGYTAEAVDTVELESKQTHTFDQLPLLRAEPVRAVNELTRAALNVLVEDLDKANGGGIELHRSLPVWLLARTSAPLAVRDPTTGEPRDMSQYFAAFVTPNAPEVMTFLRKAADHHPDRTIVGYQGEESDVEPQVRAMFAALKEAGITYVNSVLTSTPEEGFADQRVRLPRESLADREANCIDGTVLYASLLEAASMHPAVVVVPGHAFVAWQAWEGKDEWRFLETTMTGSHTFEQARDAGERTAKHYKASGDGFAGLRVMPVRKLRAERRIFPIE
ncbi:MAG TPA: hypothetical protein VF529_08545 [Solirubrobacteraceae bacterium]|jgi:hypothetical protein